MKQQFIKSTADTFKMDIYESNRKIIPTSATLTIYEPASSTKIIDAIAMTVAADGQLSYILTATHNATADENYKADIVYVYSSKNYYLTLYYDVVKSRITKIITDEDIINELPQLKDNGWRVHGQASSGTTTTIVDTDLIRYPDDYFTGGLAYSITQDETREITNYVSSTGTVTTTAFPGAVSTDKYVLTRSYTKEIQRAFEKIEDMLNQAGRRSHLILDPYDLREVHIMLSIAEICKGLVTVTDGGLWWEFYQAYDKRGYAIFKSIKLKYDEDEDNIISAAEESKKINRTIGRG